MITMPAPVGPFVFWNFLDAAFNHNPESRRERTLRVDLSLPGASARNRTAEFLREKDVQREKDFSRRETILAQKEDRARERPAEN
jgi:hypothetical protein